MVGKFFDDLTRHSLPAESEKIFLEMREAITIVFPYLGMPTCIPACYGMIGVVQRKGGAFASTRVLRKKTVDEEDARKGTELRARIYHGVGNSAIFDLMNIYFTDLCKYSLFQSRRSTDLHSYLFDSSHMGLPDFKGKRRSIQSRAFSPHRGQCDHGSGSNASDKESH